MNTIYDFFSHSDKVFHAYLPNQKCHVDIRKAYNLNQPQYILTRRKQVLFSYDLELYETTITSIRILENFSIIGYKIEL